MRSIKEGPPTDYDRSEARKIGNVARCARAFVRAAFERRLRGCRRISIEVTRPSQEPFKSSLLLSQSGTVLMDAIFKVGPDEPP